VPVTFQPSSTNLSSASITFVVTSEDGTNEIGRPVSNITGQGRTLTTTAEIATNYTAFPGQILQIPVQLNVAPDQLDDAMIDKLSFTLYYNSGMMRLQNGTPADVVAKMLPGTPLAGWTPSDISIEDGKYSITLTAPPGGSLKSAGGPLLNLEFLTFVGNAKESDLTFEITITDRACATITPIPGKAVLEEICGLDFRLIEAFGKTYALNQNSPNPFNPSTNIIFSLGLDGDTKLTVYNANGEKVAVLVDQFLQPGTYTVTWDASAQPSGMYYYRLESGVWTKTETMILRK
jgi:hypothetical protein